MHTVIVTHSHFDHFGGAARFAKETGAQIVAHRRFSFGPFPTTQEPEVSVDDLAAHHRHAHGAPADEPEDELPEALQTAIDDAHAILERARSAGRTPWGGQRPRPPFLTRMRFRVAHWLGRSFIPVISQPVEHGDVLTLGGREWFVTHTPGHTGDHICLHDPGVGRAALGRSRAADDHAAHRRDQQLARSARVVLLQPRSRRRDPGHLAGAARARPSVRRSAPRARARSSAITCERLERVREISREFGVPETVQAFSQQLFHPRSWGSMAESETYAHLEHLRIAGEADRQRRARRHAPLCGGLTVR